MLREASRALLVLLALAELKETLEKRSLTVGAKGLPLAFRIGIPSQ